MLYIGLDVGTSGCKASVCDAAGHIKAYAHRGYQAVSPMPGYVEIDARLVWGAVQETLAEIAAGPFGRDVGALAVASFGEAVVLTGAAGEVLANSIYYSDIRGAEETQEIEAALTRERATALTGMPPNAMFSANKLLWMKKHEPRLLERARHTMLMGDFIGWKLTGERAIDHSLASRTMLFDIKARRWSREAADAVGLPLGGFSEPVPSGAVIGPLLPQVAGALGFPGRVMLVAGGHDQPLAALGSGAVRPGDSVDGMGSSECVTMVLGEGALSPESLARMARYNFCAEPHVVPGAFVTLAFNASAGTAIQWFKNRFFAAEAEAAQARGENIYGLMDARCPEAPTGILFLPYVGGSGTPYLGASEGGAFVGLTLADGRDEMYKALLEGICFEIGFNLDLLAECGHVPTELTAAGGGSRSRTLMQIKADVLGRRIAALETHEAGTVALAWLCAKAMGGIASLEEAAAQGVQRTAVFEPDAGRAAYYREAAERYRRLYPAIRSIATP
ncbi:MAG: hypothetical protein LBR44_09870 [Clostridiales Family XIII bacterium]|jgi:xylulokinase|nr:hypothetical protein [Clostridiales Family XIII bacterium]